MNIKSLILIISLSVTAVYAGESRRFQPAGSVAVEKLNAGNAANIILASEQGQALLDKAGTVAKTTVAAALTKTSAEAYGIAHSTGYGLVAGAGEAIKTGVIVYGPPVAIGGAVIYGSYKTYKYFFPTAEEQAAQLETQQKIAAIESEQEFNQCLKSHLNGELELMGFPSKCSEPAFKLALINKPKSEEMITTFKQFKKQFKQDQ